MLELMRTLFYLKRLSCTVTTMLHSVFRFVLKSLNCVATFLLPNMYFFSFFFFLFNYCSLFFFPFFALGIYVCVECDHPLFSSHTKYEHQTPWPAFTKPIRNDSLKKIRESEPQESSNCYALKVSCGKCGNGLGHEFVGDGPGGKGSRF